MSSSASATPAPWIAGPRSLVKRVAGTQETAVLAGMALPRGDIADAAVAMVEVVPTHEVGCPASRLVQIVEAARRELRPVLGGAEQALGKGVVGRFARP